MDAVDGSAGQNRTGETIQIPKNCPVCGSKVVMSDDKKQAHCVNVKCPARLRESMAHYASREGMDIQGLVEEPPASDEGPIPLGPPGIPT